VLFRVALAIFKLNEQKILEVDDPLEVFQVVQVSSTANAAHFITLRINEYDNHIHIEHAKENAGLPSPYGGK
jgi:hypothetical protein